MYWLWTTFDAHSGAWAAIFAFGLLIVAALTGWFGLKGLRTANEALQLEAYPFLVVTRPELPIPNLNPVRYVIAAADKGKGLVARLRRWEPSRDQAVLPRTATGGYYGRPQWPFVIVAIKNVGRSPAIAVRLDATFKFQPPADSGAINPKPSNNESDPEAGRDYPIDDKKATGGFGAVEFAAIMPGETVHIQVENRYANPALLKFAATTRVRALSGAEVIMRIAVPEALKII